MHCQIDLVKRLVQIVEHLASSLPSIGRQALLLGQQLLEIFDDVAGQVDRLVGGIVGAGGEFGRHVSCHLLQLGDAFGQGRRMCMAGVLVAVGVVRVIVRPVIGILGGRRRGLGRGRWRGGWGTARCDPAEHGSRKEEHGDVHGLARHDELTPIGEGENRTQRGEMSTPIA